MDRQGNPQSGHFHIRNRKAIHSEMLVPRKERRGSGTQVMTEIPLDSVLWLSTGTTVNTKMCEQGTGRGKGALGAGRIFAGSSVNLQNSCQDP